MPHAFVQKPTGDAYADAARADAATVGESEEDRRDEYAMRAINAAMSSEYSHAEVDRMMLAALESVLADMDDPGQLDVTTLDAVEEAVRAARGKA